MREAHFSNYQEPETSAAGASKQMLKEASAL